MKDFRISLIGCGNMGRSLVGGLIASGFRKEMITVADTSTTQRAAIAKKHGIKVLADSQQLIKHADVVVLAVKPQSIADLLLSMQSDLVDSRPLIISVAAGVNLSRLIEYAGAELAVVRAMPNIAVLVQAGVTALFANEYTGNRQRYLAEAVMCCVGPVIWLEDENLMNAVTALSGSGPAYYFLVMEAMEKVAVQLGLSQDDAHKLTLQTAFGAAKMALNSADTVESLRDQVTSPGGTTEQAVNVLIKGGIERLFKEAMEVARDRAIELSEAAGEK